jgi:hypothetical protein
MLSRFSLTSYFLDSYALNTPCLRIFQRFYELLCRFQLDGVINAHKIQSVKKAKTNLTLDPRVKRKGEKLAKKNGLSLSAYITTLLVRELSADKKTGI